MLTLPACSATVPAEDDSRGGDGSYFWYVSDEGDAATEAADTPIPIWGECWELTECRVYAEHTRCVKPEQTSLGYCSFACEYATGSQAERRCTTLGGVCGEPFSWGGGSVCRAPE